MLEVARNSSCEKVLFSQVCVKNSVPLGRYPRQTSPWADTPLARPPSTRHSTSPGRHPLDRHPLVDTPRQIPPGKHPTWADTPLGSYGIWSTSGRYASYWNAFLLLEISISKTGNNFGHLSTVRQTRFHEDDVRPPHRRTLPFQKPHSRSPSQPVHIVFLKSFIVRLGNSNTKAQNKSIAL